MALAAALTAASLALGGCGNSKPSTDTPAPVATEKATAAPAADTAAPTASSAPAPATTASAAPPAKTAAPAQSVEPIKRPPAAAYGGPPRPPKPGDPPRR